MWNKMLLSPGDYIRERKSPIILSMAALAVINLYLGFICASKVFYQDLIYLDLIFTVGGIVLLCLDYRRMQSLAGLLEEGKRDKGMESLKGSLFYRMWEQERAEEEENYRELYEQQQELTDYIARWVHEIKIPLSSLRLMNERNKDEDLKKEMKANLERMQQLLNTMLMGSKLNRSENDVRFERVLLREVVSEAVRNQSYFLIREGFAVHVEEVGETAVYSDRRWLCYILDQLIANAVKYRKENPSLTFGARVLDGGKVKFWVEDKGIGIASSDIPYIFDNGYIGSNLRNGTYRSTGMGLYFVRKSAKSLGIEVEVSSEEGKGTRFSFWFSDNVQHYFLKGNAEPGQAGESEG